MATCPVMATINDIKSGPLYTGGDENDDTPTAIIGGVECVVDEIAFYVTSRQIALARFKLTRPNQDACREKIAEMFGGDYPTDHVALYSWLISRVMSKNHLYKQFVMLVDLIGEMEKLIVAKIDQAARNATTQVNVSLPELYLLPRIDRLIMYRPDILCVTMNKIAHYMNHINVNSLLRNPEATPALPEMAKFDHAPLVNKTIPAFDRSLNAVDYDIIAQMETALEHEVEVAKYIKDVEKYHCDAIQFINSALAKCQKIINGLLPMK